MTINIAARQSTRFCQHLNRGVKPNGALQQEQCGKCVTAHSNNVNRKLNVLNHAKKKKTWCYTAAESLLNVCMYVY